MRRMNVRAYLLAAILGVQSACGGGGGGDAGNVSSSVAGDPASTAPPTPAPSVGVPFVCAPAANQPGSNPGGIEGTGRGVAKKLTNLMVAGQAWDIGHASILIDGQPATSEQIVDGLITTVQGTIAPTAMGTADSVVSETRVAGPIASVSSAANQLIVLGQTVALTPDTQMDVSPAALSAGDTIAINALVTANGTLVATRLAPRAADLEYVVTGTVSSLDDSSHRFQINALTVDYSGVVPQGFPTGIIHDGDLVRVFGLLGGGSTTLSARDVEFRFATLPGQVGELIALYGYITRFVSNADFDVDSVPITWSGVNAPSAVIGASGPLALNDVVYVCGTLLSNGEVAATQVFLTWDY
jgi:Domain of unknown function (DUF5666)